MLLVIDYGDLRVINIHSVAGTVFTKKRHDQVIDYVKVSLSQSQLWGQSLLCHRISKEFHIFMNEYYNNRERYEYKVF